MLQRDMERSKRRLNEFCASMLQDADTKIAGHNNFMQKAGHKKNALRNEIDAYRTEATKMKGDLVTVKALEKKLEEESENLQRQYREMPERLSELRTKEEMARRKLSHLSTEVQQHSKETNQMNNDLTYGIIAFKKRLGLDFQRLGANRLKLSFTQVDPRNHSLVFSFSIHVDETDKYNMIDCSPAVSGTEELLATLNSSNDFSEFVRAMRCKFRALCKDV